MLEFLPQRIKAALSRLNYNELYEIRLRANKPVSLNYRGNYIYLCANAVTKCYEDALTVTQKEIEDCIFLASGKCVYAVENQLRQGFLTTDTGIRIGVAGDFVYENTNVLSTHSITSLCIRIPHEIVGSSKEIYERCLQNGLRSIIIISPPGLGKTTILRDLTRYVSDHCANNVLICDERGELSAGELGINSDVMRFADKETAFSAGIRALRPDVIVTDELSQEDYSAVQKVMNGGITVFASAHFVKSSSLPYKIFDFCVTLERLGKIKSIEECRVD